MKVNAGSARAAVVLVVAAAVVCHSVADDDGLVANVSYLGVLVGASAGAWIGVRRARPGRRLVPLLVAAGLSFNALGDVLWSALELSGAGTDVSIADPPWFLSYILLCAALWVVLKQSLGRRAGRVDVDFVIDVVTIVVVSVLVFWSFSVTTIVSDQTMTPLVRAVWSAYPMADAVLLALVVRVMMSPSGRAAIDVSFAVGVGLWLAADIAYLQVDEGATALMLMDAAWMIAPVLLARSAWRVYEPATSVSLSSTRGSWVVQLTIAVGPLMVPPALELIADLRGVPDQPLRLLMSFAPLMALAFARTARLIRSEERIRHELELARDEAVDASSAKSMFLANMSHEIRTPLTTVLATAEILEDTPLDGVQTDLLARMRRSGEVLKTLVEGILDFSRIEARQLGLTSTMFDLHALVTDIADTYQPRATSTGIRFACHLDPCVPQLVVGDSGRLSQILTNLIDNALKFTHQGEIVLTVRPAHLVGEGPDAGELVMFSVDDTGIGILPEDQASVFESFRQVDGSMTRQYGGSGLGLAICQQLTQLMGGSLVVHSRLGFGSTFELQLPLPQAPLTSVVPHPDAAVPV